MSAVYLGIDPLQPRRSDVDKPSGFFDKYDFHSISPTDEMKVSGWFSSLWTLQEICLRPDMWLCSRDWVLFTAGNSTPVAFNTIVAIVGECKSTLEEMSALASTQPHLDMSRSYLQPSERIKTWIAEGRCHRGFLELMELFDRTGMRDLHMIKKDYILPALGVAAIL